jgi:hypothetical protein
MSSGLKEKYATSEPDIRADPKSNRISIKIPTIILKSKALTIMPEFKKMLESIYPGSN